MEQFGEHVTLDVQDAVATIRMSRPGGNRMNEEFVSSLVGALIALCQRSDVRAAVITGTDEFFSGGGDLKEMGPATYQDMLRLGRGAMNAVRLTAALPFPVIAAIEGYALGGGLELAMAADLRVTTTEAKHAIPEIKLGITQGAGGSQRLPRLVGIGRAKEIIYTGRTVEADEALAIGLVTKVVEPGHAYEAALEMAKEFAQGPTLALAASKQLIDDGMNMSLDQGLNLEQRIFASMYATDDQKAGMKAYFETGIGTAEFEGR